MQTISPKSPSGESWSRLLSLSFHISIVWRRFLKDNSDGEFKNLSHNNLWTVAFLKGNDKKSMLKKNVTKVFRDLKNWEGKVVDCKGKNHPVITLVPCDMSTHNTVTEADHMACFRCKEKHENFRIMFEVVQVRCCMRELGTTTHTSPQDLLALNSADANVVSAFLLMFG